MICRPSGKDFLLITQHDHSRLSGELACRIGNALFAPPIPFAPVVLAISEHDCGWADNDRSPAVDLRGQPLHVFESELLASISAWEKSVEEISSRHAYAGLLVSLHSMALATHAAGRQADPEDEFARQRVFRLRRFIHRQIEVQEGLRASLGMRSDLPLRGGLAEQGRADDEDLLRINFFLLEFLDQLSLNLCFGRLVFQRIEMLYPRPGENPLSARIGLDSDEAFTLNPWPFNAPELELTVPARKIPAGAYRKAEALRDALAAAATNPVRLVLRPAGS
jgi:hypothetical protein